VNRWGLIDSNNALDGAAIPLENADMKDAGEVADPRLQRLVLERREPSRNMARFYVLAIEPTLFGELALVREWGRLGSQGRSRLDFHASLASAGRRSTSGSLEKLAVDIKSEPQVRRDDWSRLTRPGTCLPLFVWGPFPAETIL
jgi:predicted DNA-binding WGR domain protein